VRRHFKVVSELLVPVEDLHCSLPLMIERTHGPDEMCGSSRDSA